MNKLSHRRAYRLIHKPSLTTAERQMLSDHLQQCAACRQYAGVAAFLAQNLALKPVRQRPTPRQKAAFKGSVRRTSKRIQIMKPVNAIVGIAIILVFALAGWFLFRSQPETAVTLPHDETIIIATETAVPEPTEPSASVTPEITSIPPTSTLSPTQTTTTSSATQQTYTVGRQIWNVAVDDFNGDTYPDISAADSSSQSVKILVNDQTGEFQEAAEIATGGALSVVSADLDSDSDIDLAVANGDSRTVSVLLNDGDGAFSKLVDYSAEPIPAWILTSDLNNDTHQDLVITHENADIDIHLNNGDDSFQESRHYFPGHNGQAVYSAAGDLNGDGYADLAVEHYTDPITSVLMNNGDGSFGEPVDYEVGYAPHGLVIADFNADKHADIAVPAVGIVTVFNNKGDGSFQEKVDNMVDDDPWAIAVADMNEDTLTDLLLGQTDSRTVEILTNNGDGTFEAKGDRYGKAFVYYLVVTDVDRDNNRDVVVTGEPLVSVFSVESDN